MSNFLTVVRRIKRGRGGSLVCKCICGKRVILSEWQFRSGHKRTCGRKKCNSAYLSQVRKGRPRPDLKGKRPYNKIDRTGERYGKLTVMREAPNNRWVCKCVCGNEIHVLSTNLAGYKKNSRGCRYCANRKDIAGERLGLLVAEKPVNTVAVRQPLVWIFRCDCGNMIKGTVREFHAGFLRSCGCHDNVHASWVSMMARCYNPSSNRYKYYGGRGISVCKRWHKFENFAEDMGERPKRYNLSRKNAEGNYCPSNCFWEHISKNLPDTCNGVPTKHGISRGAKPRNKG